SPRTGVGRLRRGDLDEAVPSARRVVQENADARVVHFVHGRASSLNQILSMGYSFSRMRKLLAGVLLAGAALGLYGQESPEKEKKSGWPKSLADGLPKELPGYTAAPTDPLPDTDEN